MLFVYFVVMLCLVVWLVCLCVRKLHKGSVDSFYKILISVCRRKVVCFNVWCSLSFLVEIYSGCLLEIDSYLC